MVTRWQQLQRRLKHTVVVAADLLKGEGYKEKGSESFGEVLEEW
jgi:hypothetical protein